MTYCTAAQYRPTAETIEKLTEPQGQKINIGPIAEAQHISAIMRAIGTTSAKTTAALDAVIIKAGIGQHGHIILIGGRTDQQTRAAAQAVDELDFQLFGPQSKSQFLTEVPSMERKDLCQALNKIIHKIDGYKALDETTKVLGPASVKWTGEPDNVKRMLDRLQEATTKAMPVAQRLSWLKLFKQYDIENWKRAMMSKSRSQKDQELLHLSRGRPAILPPQNARPSILQRAPRADPRRLFERSTRAAMQIRRNCKDHTQYMHHS